MCTPSTEAQARSQIKAEIDQGFVILTYSAVIRNINLYWPTSYLEKKLLKISSVWQAKKIKSTGRSVTFKCHYRK